MTDATADQLVFALQCTLTCALVVCLAASTFAAGQALDLERPVLRYNLDPTKAADYENAVKTVMAMTEEEMLSFLPEYTYTQMCECPNCYGGVEGNYIFTWSPERPNEMTCKYCGTVFPNEKYPEQRTLTGQNALGEEISIPYYFNEEKQIPHFLSNHLIYLRRGWMAGQAVALGQAYRVTMKPEYARRVALILERVADRYAHYPAMANRNSRTYNFLQSQVPPYPWDGGRWGSFHNEIPLSLTRAYDLVYDSEEFDRLSEQRGYDLREKIENDLFKATFASVEAKPNHIGNAIGLGYNVTNAATLGRVIGDPYMVHWAFGWVVATVNDAFYADGMWKEGTPSYHHMTLGGLRSAFDVVRGYTDPPGYNYPDTGQRFDDLQPEKLVPLWGKVQTAPSLVDWPNGRSPCIHDTHPYERHSEPRTETVSTILPAFGHVSLGRGTGDNQMQAQLHFSGGYGHQHYDSLNLNLFAKGSEMLCDIGYTWSQMYSWTLQSLCHNLVVIDRKNQPTANSDGSLLTYFPDTEGVSVVEADGIRGYQNIEDLDMYRRMLVMIPVSDADAYVLDIFRVRGGQTHDWTVNGDADEDTTAQASIPLPESRKWMLEEGEKWKEPTLEGDAINQYGMVRDVGLGETDTEFHVTFTYEADATKGIRVHMLNADPVEVWLGRSPSVRRMGVGIAGDMRKAYDYWMPKLVVRRKADAPLHSVFTAVHEPIHGTPFIGTVEHLELTPADENAVGIRVTHGDATDTIISTLDAAPYPERKTADGISLRGRLGIVRQVAGVTTAAWLFEGDELTDGRQSVKAPAAEYTGQVLGVTRKAEGAEHDAFVTDADLPTDGSLDGLWMIVTHGDGINARGFEIDHVEQGDGNTVVILTDDPGLKIDGATTSELYHPARSFEGANLFRIPCATAFSGGR
jgi:hypothetical protein